MSSAAKASKNDGARRAELAGDDAQLVRHYAEALVTAAANGNQADAVIDDLEAIDREVLNSHPELKRVFASDQVSSADKDRILVKVFEGRVSDIVLRFLRVLNRRGRLGLISPLARQVREVWDRRHKRIPVLVRTAFDLDQDQQATVRDRIGKLVDGTPLIQYTTDPSLIGGLIVQVGDQVYDSSVRNRLEQVRQRLIEGKTHEIQSRRDQFSHSA